MSQYNKLEVIDKDGWQKIYALEKSIIYIGSQRRSKEDIVLEPERGGGVEPLHAQLIAAANDHAGYQLVNLAREEILVRSDDTEQTLPPHAVLNLAGGETLIVGDFTLVFHRTGAPADRLSSGSRRIGMRLSMPETRLAPSQSLQGVITVSNLGDQAGAQLELELEGLDPECYDIEPGPLLSAGAEKEVFFWLHHRGAKPLAGDRSITFRATAAKAYPGEQAAVSQVIRILPLYRHSMRLLPPGWTDELAPAEKDLSTPKVKAKPQPPAETRAESPAPVSTLPQEEALWPSPVQAVPTVPTEAAPVPPATVGEPAEAGPVAPIKGDTQPQATPAPRAETEEPQVSIAEATIPPSPDSEQQAQTRAEADLLPQAEQEQPTPAKASSPSPVKQWWAQLVQSLPFYRRQAPVAPPDSVDTSQLPVAKPESIAQARPGEPLQAEQQQMPAIQTSLPVQVEPEQLPQAEVGGPLPVEAEKAESPQIEAELLSPLEEEPILQAQAGLPLPPEETQIPVSEGEPPSSAEEEVVTPVEADRTPPPVEAEPTPAAGAEPPPDLTEEEISEVSIDRLSPAADWQEPAEAETPPEKVEVEQGLKDQAGPPAPAREPERSVVGAEVPPEPEDSWTSALEASAPAQVEKKPVLKLKASPPVEQAAEVEAASRQEAEDLWTADSESDA